MITDSSFIYETCLHAVTLPDRGGDAGVPRILRLSCQNESSQPVSEKEIVVESQVEEAQAQARPVRIQSLVAEGPGGTMTLYIHPEATVGEARDLVTARCGGGGVAAHIRMVRRFTSAFFLPLQDEARICDVISEGEDLLLLGVDLAGVEADEVDEPSTSEGKQSDAAEATESPEQNKAKDAASFLIAAMELLEDSEVQEGLMSLSSSALLAEWEPPWVVDGVEDLDAAALDNFPESTVLAWAQSFSSLIDAMAGGLEAEETAEVEEIQEVANSNVQTPGVQDIVEDNGDVGGDELAISKTLPAEPSPAEAAELHEAFKDL